MIRRRSEYGIRFVVRHRDTAGTVHGCGKVGAASSKVFGITCLK
jgi:hypothetical protein